MVGGVMNCASLRIARVNASSAITHSLIVTGLLFPSVVLNRNSKSPADGALTPVVKSLIRNPSLPVVMVRLIAAISSPLWRHICCRRSIGAKHLQEPAGFQPGRTGRHRRVELER